ncbi:DUF3093 family protein [Microbacterium sp.]|uniref:DUF3093 family protein n=1 Tax=Microbacterium sp. TaxID=51671 RepID=UPI0039E52449
MHAHIASTSGSAVYRERLSPSLWLLVSAAVCAPMVALVFTPFDSTVALIAGAATGAAVVAALMSLSPVVEIADDWLRVGRARIELRYLGDAEALVGQEARLARGPGLGRYSWHLIRGGIDGIVRVPVQDADDPVTMWVFSSRTPDRVAAALRRARSTS